MRFSRDERALLTDWWLTVDRVLFTLMIILALCGAIASLVASPLVAAHLRLEPFYFAKRHAIATIVAVITAVLVSFMRPDGMRRFSLLLFFAGIALLIATWLHGEERNGAIRWLSLWGMTIQPSEFVKPGFVVLSAWLLSESIRRPDMPALELSLASLGGFLALLVVQPDMGQSIIVAAVWCGLFFLSGYSLRYLPLFIAAGLLGLVGAYFTLPHFASRIDRFAGMAGDAHQVTVAATAFRDAGWLGHGFGEGFTKTRLPDAHNDYIFAAIAEELGIAACLVLVLIYALIVWRVMRRVFGEQDPFIRLAIAGLVMIFGFQALINMAVNLNLLPTKGVTLPLVSYGRSSLLSSAITLGMLLGLTRRGVTTEAVSPFASDQKSVNLGGALFPKTNAVFTDTTALTSNNRSRFSLQTRVDQQSSEESYP